MKEIEALRDAFRQAHAGMSFSPDARAESRVREFSAELAADISELGDKAGNYAQKYAEHLRNWTARIVITSYSIHYTKLYEAMIQNTCFPSPPS